MNGKFYVNGNWVEPTGISRVALFDPATGNESGWVALGNKEDVSAAVASATHAFRTFSRSTKLERIEVLRRLLEACEVRRDQFSIALSREVGIPIKYATEVQTEAALEQIRKIIKTLQAYEFEVHRGSTRIVREAIGVVAMITPWNWPLVQIICKVAPALAAGCSMVLKPSELAPTVATVFAEAVHAADIPRGVFNLVHGDGVSTGEPLVTQPEIAMISFTGSTAAGVRVAKLAADTVKRVTQELGGKSPFIVLPDADVAKSVKDCVDACFANNGQTCDAPTRLFVPKGMIEVAELAARTASAAYVIGAPCDQRTTMGPLVSRRQFERVREYIAVGLAEGAKLVAGNAKQPDQQGGGYFVEPTVFSDATPAMRIAQEEIFGPVLTILPYEELEDAICMANDSPFGLAAYVHGRDLNLVRDVARRMEAGTVYINSPDTDLEAPFGGYKQSGNGREYGSFGLEEYLEVKSLVGYDA